MYKKRVAKKFIIYITTAFFLSFFLSFIYIFFSQLPDSIDNRLRDNLFTLRGEIPTSNNIVIVDIDEKSLQQLGQWPWSRNKVSKILENLTNANTGIIGLDIVFPEADNSSPHKIFDEFNVKKENIPNYDLIFAQTVASTPTILGYQFELLEDKHVRKTPPKIPAIFIEKNKELGSDYLIKAKGTILNIPLIQENAYSSGFFNNDPDESGITRNVPLVISYDDTIYPSLSFELIRIILDANKVYINYDQYGVENISIADVTIPTDRHGRLLVNFRGKEQTFKYFSAVDIFNNNFDKKEFKDKIVLIGTSSAGLLDLRATPFDSIFPGVEVHANIIDNIIQGDFIHKASWVEGTNLAIIFVLSFTIILLITYTPFWINPIISIGFLGGMVYIVYTMLFTYGVVLNLFFPILTIILASIIATLFDYFYEIKQEEAIKKKFASKVSKDVMDNLLKNIDSNEFQAMEKEVTVFFSDIRNFTNISEKMGSAQNLITYLNKYMEPMSNTIIKHQGTIDKYIGDAIMAYWNAPADVENHADKAVIASLEQINSLVALNEKLQMEKKPLIDIGIGLNTGIAVVGEMGSVGRSDYTVIGDAINLGARLESLCKYYGSRLNISNFTKEKLKEEYIFRFLDYVTVKGKEEPIEIWQVHGKGKVSEKQKKELEDYHMAVKLYQNSKFDKALEIFNLLNNDLEKTNERIYDIYINRCKEFIKTPPKDFNGVYEHSTKG